MEVSGRRLTLVTICEPCQTENLSKQADGFCTDCKEYMCQVCFLHHLKAKSCRNHVLNPINTGSSESELQMREEKCKKHVEETIKYYCRNHDSVLCGDCLVSDHPMCEPNFIKDIANNVETSSEFKDLQSRMPTWEADKAEGEMRVERNRKENKALLDNALQKLKNSREEINVWLDKMEKNIKTDVREISNYNEVVLSEVEKNLQAVSDDIDKIKEKMDANLYQRETLFINMVECKPKLGIIEAILSDIKTNNKIRAYAFEPEIKVHETSASSLRLGIIEVSSNMNKEETKGGSQDDYSDQFTVDVEVEYDYKARESDELTIKTGDIIKNVVEIGEGWSEGELNGKKGMFPNNYVKVIEYPKKDTHNDALKKKDVGCSEESVNYQTKNIQGQVLEGPSVICKTGTEDKHLHKADTLRLRAQQTVTFNERETPRESVKLLKKLHSGSFGNIFSGKWCGTVDVAVKTMREEKNTTADDFLQEAKILYQLDHERIIQLIAVCTKLKPIWIITDLMVNGNLLIYLREDGGKHLQFTQLTDMAGQIASGMAYLETMNCVHRNLRASHILLGNCHEVKIAHFHMAHFLHGEECLSQPSTNIPVKWTAPEAAIGGKFSIKSDVWSYGVLLQELITLGQVPYPGIKNEDVITMVEQGYRMPQKTDWPLPCPDPYYDIMLQCWKKEANLRPTFEYLQDFFENYMVASEERYDEIKN